MRHASAAARCSRPSPARQPNRPALFDGPYTQEAHQLDHLRRDRSLSPAARLVGIAVNRLTVGWQQAEAVLTYAQLAEEAGLGRTAVVAAITELEERGYLIVTRQPGAASVYRLWFVRPPLRPVPSRGPEDDPQPILQPVPLPVRDADSPSSKDQRQPEKGESRPIANDEGTAPTPGTEASVTPTGVAYPAAGIGSRARRLAFWPLARTAEERLALTEPVDGTTLRAPDDGWWRYEARSGLWRCMHVGPTQPDHLHSALPVQSDEDDARLTPAERLALLERLNHRAHPAARRSG